MDILNWFEVDNYEHINAYVHLQETGCWPENFIPENIDFCLNWNTLLMAEMAYAYTKNFKERIEKK